MAGRWWKPREFLKAAPSSRAIEWRLSVVALLVGALAAYAALAFRMFTDLVSYLAYGVDEESMALAASGMPAWQLLAVTTGGGLLLGLLTRFLLPGPLPQGVAEVMEASALRNGRMPWQQGLAAAGLSVGSIGIGASVGREGPIVHLSATLASQIARILGLDPALSRTLLGCAVAGGVAAAFNAPIAGVFFALEVVVGHYGLGAFSPVVIASMMGTVITRIHIGSDAAFAIGAQEAVSFWEVPAFLLLGLICALVAIAMMRGVVVTKNLHQRFGVPDWLQPAIGGAALGLIALVAPQALGIGYAATSQALDNLTPIYTLLTIGVAKAVATSICLGSRFGGGIFSPSLTLGALVGGSFGLIAAALFPELGSPASVYAVIGMAALAASTLGAPISTVIMIFELTTDYGMTFAIMAAVAIASFTTRALYGNSFFHMQLEARGIDIEQGRELGLLHGRRVADIMDPDPPSIPSDANLDAIRASYRQHGRSMVVVAADDTPIGIIDAARLADAVCREREGTPLTAASLARRSQVRLNGRLELSAAMMRAARDTSESLLVLSDQDEGRAAGILRRSALVEAYNHALIRARAIEQGRG